MEKMTKKMAMAAAIEILNAVEDERVPAIVEKLEKEIQLLEKKKTSVSAKAAAKKAENLELADQIYQLLEAEMKAMNISEIRERVENLSAQKISYLLRTLVNDGRVEREYVKKVPYFSIVAQYW